MTTFFIKLKSLSVMMSSDEQFIGQVFVCGAMYDTDYRVYAGPSNCWFQYIPYRLYIEKEYNPAVRSNILS